MRNSALLLSLVLITIIPLEGVVKISGMGTAATAVGFVVSAYWLAVVVITGRFRKPSPFQIVIFLFVLWNALSVFWSEDPNRTVAHVMTWVQMLVLVFIFWDLFTTRSALLAGLQAYVLGAFVAIGSAGANFFSGNVYYTHYQRYSPGDTNPDGFGFLLALAIPVAWYLASRPSTTKMSRLLKFVNYAFIPAAFLGLSLSGTRTAMIASLVGMAFGLATLSRVRLWIRVAILVCLIAAILILLPQVQTLRSFQRFDTTADSLAEGDLNQRTDIWRDGLASFVERPLIGVGGNMYRSVNSLGKVAHNTFLSVLVELGLIGFVLFGIILTMAIIKAVGQPKWEAGFWLTVLMVWAIGAFTLTWEYRRSTWLFLSLLIASAAVASQRYTAVAHVWRTEPGVFVVPFTGRRTGASLPLEVSPAIGRHLIEYPVGADTSPVALNQENASIAAATLERPEMTKLAQAGVSDPDEAHPVCSNPQCEQSHIIRNGKTKAGRQRYKCKTCQTSFTGTSGTVFYRRRTPEKEIMENLAMVAQGDRLSSVARVKGHSKDTILAWIRDAAEHAEAIEAKLSADYRIKRAQLDALWAYAGIEETSPRVGR